MSVNDVKLLSCPRCGNLLVRVRNENDVEATNYTWVCGYWGCRGMEPEFPLFYGYTQKDVDENETKKIELTKGRLT